MIIQISGKVDFTVKVEVEPEDPYVRIIDIWSNSSPEIEFITDEDDSSPEDEEDELHVLGMKVADALRSAIEPTLTTRSVYLKED